MQVSEPMQRLRNRLDELGVKWDDNSLFDHYIRHEQTIIYREDGYRISVIYIVGEDFCHGEILSYHYPGAPLECWDNMDTSTIDPKAMSVDEIIKLVKETCKIIN